MIEHQVAFALAGVAVVVLGSLVARRLSIPVPVVLVLAGLAYATLTGRNVELDPELVLALIIPPLLYSAAIEASLIDIRANLRPVASLSVGLVLATAFAVGGILQWVVPGLPFGAALALGAAVAPPDPIAALPLTLADGEPLPGRELLLLCAYLVVLVTLVGQGLTLRLVVRMLGLQEDRAGRRRAVAEARVVAAEAALAQLEEMAEDGIDPPVLDRVRKDADRRLRRTQERAHLQSRQDAEERDGLVRQIAALRRALLDAERRELLRRRDSGELRDTDLRTLQRELDHEERLLSRGEPD